MFRTINKSWVSRGVLLGAALLVSALTSASLVIAAPLEQAGTGTITGQVLDLDNVALPNVHLAAFAQAPGTPNRVKLGEFQSDTQGRYSVQVPAGQVWMEFETQDIGGQSFWGYDNLPVDVAAGQTVSGQDFRVAIRVVSEPPTAVQEPSTIGSAPGMPRTGAGLDQRLPLASALGLIMLLLGVVQRRRVAR